MDGWEGLKETNYMKTLSLDILQDSIIILTKTKYVDRLSGVLKKQKIKNVRIFTVKNRPKVLPKSTLGISYCYPRLVTEEELKMPTHGWINFHPAPLPEFKGGDPYTDGFNKSVTEWGVTIHKMTKEYDEGEIISVEKFDLGYSPSSRDELGAIAHHYCFKLFSDTIGQFARGRGLYPWKNF